jgi:tetratricopeptide (TPR) repeat protein
LYASCLENIGIKTALVSIPGHIFLIFDTGIHKKNADVVSYDEDSYIIRNNHIWIPIETTEIGTSFLNAWRKGMEEYRRGVKNKELELIDVQSSWEVYPPVALPPPKDITISLPSEEIIMERLERDILEIEQYKEKTFERLNGEYKEKARVDPVYHNRLGILYGKRGEYEKAVEEFKKAGNTSSAHNNLGNIYLLMARDEVSIEKAAFHYEKARKTDMKDGGICLNLGILYLLLGEDKENVVLPTFVDAFYCFPREEDVYSALGLDEEVIEEIKGLDIRLSMEEIKELLGKARKKVPRPKPDEEVHKPEITHAKVVKMRDKVMDELTHSLIRRMLYWKE